MVWTYTSLSFLYLGWSLFSEVDGWRCRLSQADLEVELNAVKEDKVRWSRERGFIIKEGKIEIENSTIILLPFLLPILLIGFLIGIPLRLIAFLLGKAETPW